MLIAAALASGEPEQLRGNVTVLADSPDFAGGSCMGPCDGNSGCHVGSCRFTSCFPWRGPTNCVSSGCQCKAGFYSCLVVNRKKKMLPSHPHVCVNSETCDRLTTGTCNTNHCYEWRGPTDCVTPYHKVCILGHCAVPSGTCLCKPGYCANPYGRCVRREDYEERLAAGLLQSSPSPGEIDITVPAMAIFAALFVAMVPVVRRIRRRQGGAVDAEESISQPFIALVD